jgi:hypothetical protein
MRTIPIYTIGYGNRSIGDFVKLLQNYEIKFQVDIRSQPYSRFNPSGNWIFTHQQKLLLLTLKM